MVLTVASIVDLRYVFRVYNIYFLANSGQLCSAQNRNHFANVVDCSSQLLTALIGACRILYCRVVKLSKQ